MRDAFLTERFHRSPMENTTTEQAIWRARIQQASLVQKVQSWDEQQCQVFDSRNNWKGQKTSENYGSSHSYNAYAYKTVENLNKEFAHFLRQTDGTIKSYQDFLVGLLTQLGEERRTLANEHVEKLRTQLQSHLSPERLAEIHQHIAHQQKDVFYFKENKVDFAAEEWPFVKAATDAPSFGRWREATRDEKVVCSFTGMNGHHAPANIPIKDVMRVHFEKLSKSHKLKEEGTFKVGRSIYKITHHKNQELQIQFTHKKTKKVQSFTAAEYDELSDNAIKALCSKSTRKVCYGTYDDPIILGMLADNLREDGSSILIGEIQTNIEGRWVTLSTHATWLVDGDWDRFMEESLVRIIHTPVTSFEPLLKDCAVLLKSILTWTPEAPATQLSDAIAEFHYKAANGMFFDRGSAGITKILAKSFYAFHGFEMVPSCKEEDLEAMKQPYLDRFIKHYATCFTKSPIAACVPQEIAAFKASNPSTYSTLSCSL